MILNVTVPLYAAEPAPRSRSLSGRILSYGVRARPGGPWSSVSFAAGSLQVPKDLSRVKLLRDHDTRQPLGVLAALHSAEDGADADFVLGSHPAAEEALTLAADRVLDGLSVGVEPIEWEEDQEGDGVTITRAELREVSLVALPAYADARVAAREEGNPPMAPTTTAPATPKAETELADRVPGQLSLDDVHAAVREALTAAQAPAEHAPLTPPAPAASDTPSPDAPSPVVHARDRRDPRVPGVIGRDGTFVTAGDYFAAYAAGVREGDWERHNAIRAALADQVTSDVPGLLPKPIVGELLGRAPGRRPVWDSLTSREMPMQGETFSRPRITQHVKVDEQKTQKTEVATQKYKAELEDVAKTTLAGALDVAQQAIDWTSPALLNELILDFTRIYIQRTDHKAAADLVAAATGTPVTWDGTAAKLTETLAQAAGNVYNAEGEELDAFPNIVWLSVDQWVKLASLTDSTGRPLLPALGPQNAPGQIDYTNPERGVSGNGFRWVVSKNLPEGTFIMGDSSLTESYENGRRFLQAVRPDVLGLDMAYMGYVADYFPYPKTLVKITAPAPSKNGG